MPDEAAAPNLWVLVDRGKELLGRLTGAAAALETGGSTRSFRRMNELPLPQRIGSGEVEGWVDACTRAIGRVYGNESAEVEHWRDDARRRDQADSDEIGQGRQDFLRLRSETVQLAIWDLETLAAEQGTRPPTAGTRAVEIHAVGSTVNVAYGEGAEAIQTVSVQRLFAEAEGKVATRAGLTTDLRQKVLGDLEQLRSQVDRPATSRDTGLVQQLIARLRSNAGWLFPALELGLRALGVHISLV